MKIPARLSFVTLAVTDMPRMQRFYDQFGWPKSKHSDESFAAYQCGGAVLGLFGAANYAKVYGKPPAPAEFRGFILALNCRDAAEVDRVYEAMKVLSDVTVRGAPQDLSFGGRGFDWSDPEGNLWEVTWAEGTSFDDREGLIFP